MYSVIFDMDGTLIDTQRVYVDAWEISGRKQGLEGLGSLVKYVCGMKHEDSIRFAKSNYPTLDTERFFADYMPYAQENKNVSLLPGVIELFEYLKGKGVRMAIASSSPMHEVVENVESLGIAKYFSALVSGDDVKRGKPAPDIFLLAAEKLGTPPEKCYVFEDSPNGIRAGYDAGMRCFGVPNVAIFNDEIKSISFGIIDSIDLAIKIFEEVEG